MDAGESEPAEILGEDIRRDEAVRRASSVEVDAATLRDVEARLDAQRGAIGAFFGCNLAAREGVGFLRYRPGGFYRPHRDRGVLASWPAAALRRISVVVFLNGAAASPGPDAYAGGELRLFDEQSSGPVEFVPRQGGLVAFPSTLLHEVATVTAGTRDTVVDWFY